MGTVLPLEGLKLDHLGKKDGAGWQKSDGMYFPDVLMPQIRCYTCVNADSHEECNAKGPIVCKNSQASCETEVRVVHVGTELRPRITKVTDRKFIILNEARGDPKVESFKIIILKVFPGDLGD